VYLTIWTSKPQKVLINSGRRRSIKRRERATERRANERTERDVEQRHQTVKHASRHCLLHEQYCGRYTATDEEDNRGTRGKRSEKKNVDSGLRVQLEEDGDGSTRQSGMETSGLWSVIHWERQGVREAKQVTPVSAARYSQLTGRPHSLAATLGFFRKIVLGF